MRKSYFGKTGSQIHVRETGDGGVPLICLPPAPHTGTFFETVMPLLAKNRKVIAVDYPGYGGSDHLNGEVSIEVYAKSLIPLLEEYETFELLGFHTGNLIAAEIDKIISQNIQKIVMVDVPFFDAETRHKYTSGLSKNAFPDTVEAGYEKAFKQRHISVSEKRAYDLWVETLRSGDRRNEAFRAAFSYNARQSFPAMKTEVYLIATQSSLLDMTREAAGVIPKASLIEALDIEAPVFEAHSNEISKLIISG